MPNPFAEFDPAPTGPFTTANGDTPESIMDAIMKLDPSDRTQALAAFNEQAKRTPTFSTTGFTNAPTQSEPNPFAAFDTPTQTNPFAEFDTVDKKHPMKDLAKDADTAVQTGDEAIRFGLSGFLGGLASGPLGVLKTLNDKASGRPSDLEQNIQNIGHDLTYTPKTPGGIEAAERISDFSNQNLNPLLGHMGGFDAGNPYSPKKGEVTPIPDVVPKTALDKIVADQAKMDAAAKAPNPFAEFDPTDPFAQMKQQLDVPQTLPDVEEPATSPVMDNVAQGLQDQPMTAEQMNRGAEADKLAADRQAQMELEVKQKATLDYNAAERARQEQASLPPVEDPGVATANPAVKGWNELLENEMRKDDPTSGTPAFFKDPNADFPNPPLNVPRGQRGAINPEVFKEGFEKLKQLADGTWLRATSDGRGLTITAIKDSRELGSADFLKPRDVTDDLRSGLTSVTKDARGKGIATEMYKFASELGNDVSQSLTTSADGKAMWKGFEDKGIAQNGTIKSPGNKQRGAVLFGKDPIQEQLRKIPGFENVGKDTIPADPVPADVIKAGLDYGRDNPNISKNLDSGAYMRYLKSRGNGLILGISQIVQNMGKRVDLQYRQVVHPVEAAFRGLSRDELSTVVSLLKMEDANQKVFSPENLMSNLNAKQLSAYTKFRNSMDYLHTVQNGIRKLNGMPEVKKIEGYVAHNFEGDFRRPIYQAVLDKNGNPSFDTKGEPVKKLVGYLASNWKHGLEAQSEALRKARPDLEIDAKNDHTIRYYGRNTDFEGAYSKIIDFLGRDDPAVQRLQEYMEDLTTGKAETVLQQTKHFEDRAGVFGWVGTRPGTSPKAEAIAFMEEQMKYMKNGIKWYEAQKTVPSMREILNNPDLRQQQPKNMEFARDYWKNATGFGTQAAFAAAQDSLRALGTAPQLFDKGINGLKTYFILDKLAGSLGFVAAQMIQTANVLPHLTYLFSKGYRGDPISALGVGLPTGVLMAGLHFRRVGGDMNAKFMEGLSDDHFLNRAFKYAEDNGVITKSVNDESSIGSAFNVVAGAAKIAGKTISGSEAFVRGMAYMTFAQFLKNSGKFKNDAELFQMAEAHTHNAMVDYRSSERPMIFPKMGIAGNFLNTLQTWGMNWYNQFNFAAREASGGNVAPVLAMTMLAYATGGIMNVPYMADLDRLYEFARDHIPSTAIWMKVKNDPFWRDPKMWMANHFGESSVWGAVSVNNPWGASVSSRVTAPTPFEMAQNPAGPITDLYKKGASIAHAVAHPTDPTALKQTAMDLAPVALKGPLETSKLMEGTAYDTKNYTDGTKGYVVQRTGDLGAHTGVYTRNEQEQKMRPFGFRSQKEVTEKEVGYRLTNDNKQEVERSKGLVDSLYNAIRTGNEKDAQDYAKTYTMLTGKPIDSDMLNKKLLEEYTDTLQRAGLTASKSVSSITGYVRAKQLVDKLAAERK